MSKGINRRMFLHGAAGTALAIPFLPSLLSKTYAADPGPGEVGKCFLAICMDHGGVWGTNMYPSDAILTQEVPYAGRQVRYGNLPSAPDDKGNVVFSPMCTASAQVMTPELAAKFNILRGVDVPYRIGHGISLQVGNAAEKPSGNVGGQPCHQYRTATIDQVMAYSPSFYTEADLANTMTQRSFCIGNGTQSWNFSSPSTKTGDLVSQPYHVNNKALFDFFFNPGTALSGINAFIIDGVKESYDRLKKNPRLSKGDLARLNQHLERMFEIERKLLVIENLGGPPIAKPTTDSDANFDDVAYRWSHKYNAKYCHLMNDVIVAAFETGVSRVGSWRQHLFFVDEIINNWHGEVAHGGLGAGPDGAQKRTLAWHQGSFEHVMVDLAAKLDSVTAADGKTLLDHSLLTLTSESGQYTHQTRCVNFPVVMAGGAGGYFKTGMFVDFCNTTKVYPDLEIYADLPLTNESPGLYYQQFLANALMSMGVPAEEWETFTELTPDGPAKSNPTKGYGFHFVNANKAADYAEAKLKMSDPLPVIT